MGRLDTNKAPYFDDFDKSKNYMRVLFNSGKPVQTRELNTLQSTLHNQIESFANHIFQNGSKISNARTNMRPIDYVRLKGNPINSFVAEPYSEVLSSESTSVSGFTEGFKLVGEISKIPAILVKAVDQDNGDPATLYVVYSGTGVDGTTTTFIPGEPISFIDSDGVKVYTVGVRCPSCTNTVEMPPTGKGMIFDIDEGVFYFEGMFIQNTRQSIIVHKYFSSSLDPNYTFINRPCKIGLDMLQTIVTHEEDDSLLDPSLGYPNSTAPGAHRYKVDLQLSKRAYDSSDGENFILLCRVGENSNIEYMKSESEYSDIMDMIAQRSFETNGNYTIRPFKIRFLEHRKETASDPNGWSISGLESNVVALLSPSVAYVRGYRIEKVDDVAVVIPKARTTKVVKGFVTQLPERTYILLQPTTVSGSTRIFPNADTDQGLLSRTVLNLVNSSNAVIGSCRVNDVRLNSGTNGVAGATYRYYITDLNMVGSNQLSQVTGATADSGFVATKVGSGPFELFNANSNELVFEIPRENIESIRDADDSESGSVTFTGRRKLTGTLDSNGTITFSSTVNQSFLGVSDRTIVWVVNAGAIIPIQATGGNYVTTGSSLTINLGSPNANRAITVFADVLYTEQKERQKTLNTGTFTTTETNQPLWTVGSSGNLTLANSDVYSFRVFWVKNSGLSNQSEEEITSEYVLDANSTDTAYGYSKVIRVKNEPSRTTSPNDRIRVDYTYFSHGGTGAFYSIDSYPIDSQGQNIQYDEVPVINLSDGTRFGASSALDFRPDILGNTGPIQGILPAPDTPAIFDVEYYLPRADLIQIDKDGRVYAKSGVPSESPKLPKPDQEAMVLYEVWFKPYTYSLNDVTTKFIENKRYTMRDIGRLENRIENLEYYTTLNLLEKSAVDMSIKDENGLDRFKNGLIADNFRDFQAADLTSPELRAGADRELGELRPQFKSRNHKLRANKGTSSQNIEWAGNVATMKYTQQVVNFNPFASKHISINPYYIFNKKGTLILSPNNDTWTDETRLPNVVTDIDAGVEEIKKLESAKSLLGTDWGSWIDQNNTILGKPADQMESSRFIGADAATGGLTKTWLTETRPVDNGGAQGGSTTGVTQKPRGTIITVDSRTQSYTINDIVKDVRLIPYMREIDVEFYASKLRPNTRIYAFFNGEEVSQFCRPTNLLPTPSAVGIDDYLFGSPMITNESGEFAGVFRIPEGRFFVGEKRFKLSNDPSGRSDPDIETTSCESSFFAGGLDVTRQDTTLNIITPIIDIKDIVEDPIVDEPVVNPPPPPTGTICDELIGAPPSGWASGCAECVVGREGLFDPVFGFNYVQVNPAVPLTSEQLVQDLTGSNIPSSVSTAGASFVPAAANSNQSNGAIIPNTRVYRVNQGIINNWNLENGVMSVNNFLPFAQVARWRNTCTQVPCEGPAPTPCSWCSTNGWVVQHCWDPVAQSFSLERDSFVTAIDIYLKEVDQLSNDIWVELRTMLNGYPTETVLSKKELNLAELIQSRIDAGDSSGTIVSENATIPIHITFDFPVFVKGNTQYCFVVGGYSPNTRIWVARLGQEDVTTPGKVIETPPTQMPSFRSLNGATWNAEQFETIKYNIYVARFQLGEMRIDFNLQNQDEMKYAALPTSIRNKIRLSSYPLEVNPIETENASTFVRVFVQDHGFTESDIVNISLFDGVELRYTPISGGGVPFVGQPIVFGSSGSENVAVVKSVEATTNGYSLKVTSTFGDLKMADSAQAIGVQVPEIRYTPRDEFVFTRIKSAPEFGLLPPTNGTIARNAFNIGTGVGSAYPFLNVGGIPNEDLNKDHIIYKVDSQDSFIIQVNSAATFSGRVGGANVSLHQFNEKYDVFNVSGSYLAYGAPESWTLQGLYYGPAESPFSSQNNQTTTPLAFTPSEDNFLSQPYKIVSSNQDSLKVSVVLTNSNQWLSPVVNTDTFSITTISNRIEWLDESDFNTDPNDSGRFVQETDPQNGSESYKYITKNVILQDPANELRIFFDVYRDKDADFDVYVKRQTVYDDLTLEQLPWTKATINKNRFSVDLTDRIEYSVSCQEQVDGWLDDNDDPIPFIGFKVKLVGKSKNSCKPVTFRSFRAIAVT